jgi:uncharacterized glyoxalase superfamily protein PhnB
VNNRSAPPGTIVPNLCYRATAAAIEWLCLAFGFTEDVRWGPPEMPSAQLFDRRRLGHGLRSTGA